MMIVIKPPFIVEKNTCTLWKWLKGDIKYYNKNVCKRHVSFSNDSDYCADVDNNDNFYSFKFSIFQGFIVTI